MSWKRLSVKAVCVGVIWLTLHIDSVPQPILAMVFGAAIATFDKETWE